MVASPQTGCIKLMKDGFASIREFAAIVDVTRQAIEKAIKTGRIRAYDSDGAPIDAEARGRKFVKIDEARISFSQQRARIDEDFIDEVEELGVTDPNFGASPAPPTTIVAAKTEREMLQAQYLRMRIDRERGELISRHAIVDAMSTAGLAVGRTFQTLPSFSEEVAAAAQAGGVAAVAALLREKSRQLQETCAEIITAAAKETENADEEIETNEAH